MMRREDIELMAPAGSYESLMAAIQGGADSVYFGIEQLNMRARSSANFSKEDLPEIVRIAKENGLKTYLTINTVVYNNELDQMREIVDTAVENNVTGRLLQGVQSHVRDGSNRQERFSALGMKTN